MTGTSDGLKPDPEKSAWRSPVLQWLALLSLQAWAVVAFQSILGWGTGSIELLADVPHSAVDAFTYSFNCGVECMKLFALQSLFIDSLGGVISVAALLAVTAFIVYEAVEQLKQAPPSIYQVNDDPRGMAMLLFAIGTLASNVAMLVLYRCWGLTMSKSGEEEQEALLNGEVQSADVAAVYGTSSWFRRKKPGFTKMQWFHGILHPGCFDSDCLVNTQHDAEGQREVTEGSSVNLNLAAAALHLVSDLLRAVTVLLSGMLIQNRLFNATYVDAIGSLFIAGFNLIGVGALVVKAARG